MAFAGTVWVVFGRAPTQNCGGISGSPPLGRKLLRGAPWNDTIRFETRGALALTWLIAWGSAAGTPEFASIQNIESAMLCRVS